MTTAREKFPFSIKPGFETAASILAVVTLIRLMGLMLSDVELFTDESQYWSWSRELAWGYFSKPPLLPWIIHLSEAVCGSTEACVRASSPLLYCGVCLIVYFVAANVYDEAIGFWAAILMALGPGLIFSARIISTDVPLIFFWALALLAYVKLRERLDWRWAVLLGVSLGLGCLAKYAMGYFLLGMLVAALFDSRSRALLMSSAILLALGIAAVIVAPNILWVWSHNFSTFRSVAESAESDSGFRFHVSEALGFIGAQFGVFGPVVFGLLIYQLVTSRSSDKIPADRIMIAFAIPPLAVITMFAMFSKAYANWAAPSIASATILASALIVKSRSKTLLAVSLALGVTVQGVLLYTDAVASRLALPFLPAGKSDVYRRTLGYRGLASQIDPFVAQTGARTIAGEDRNTVAGLLYYRRHEPQTILVWRSPEVRQFAMTRALSADAEEPILFVTPCAFPARLETSFRAVKRLGEIEVPTGPTSHRIYEIFSLGGAKGEPKDLAECAPG
jgi:4-amino-4-deoxy-L-arabinose transferase-like glycosyltransferase